MKYSKVLYDTKKKQVKALIRTDDPQMLLLNGGGEDIEQVDAPELHSVQGVKVNELTKTIEREKNALEQLMRR